MDIGTPIETAGFELEAYVHVSMAPSATVFIALLTSLALHVYTVMPLSRPLRYLT